MINGTGSDEFENDAKAEGIKQYSPLSNANLLFENDVKAEGTKREVIRQLSGACLRMM